MDTARVAVGAPVSEIEDDDWTGNTCTLPSLGDDPMAEIQEAVEKVRALPRPIDHVILVGVSDGDRRHQIVDALHRSGETVLVADTPDPVAGLVGVPVHANANLPPGTAWLMPASLYAILSPMLTSCALFGGDISLGDLVAEFPWVRTRREFKSKGTTAQRRSRTWRRARRRYWEGRTR